MRFARYRLDPRWERYDTDKSLVTQIREVVSHFVSHNLAPEAFIHLFFDVGCKNVAAHHFVREVPNDLFGRHAAKVQERAIGDHVAVLPVHHQDHLLQAFHDSLVFPQAFLRLLAFGDVAQCR